jgi:ABC-2 type transport system ATP-binding protein
MSEVAIEIKDLSKRYGSLLAVNQLNLKIEAGVIFGFLGPNGAGKTTTIRMLLGLIKPTSGTAQLLGCDIATQRSQILPQIGAIVETPTFYSYLSGRDNLRELALAAKLSYSNNRIEEVLSLVELKERAADKVKNYSLGMKQRLGIAAALLNNPRLIFLDEPTNGLDPQGTVEIRQLILRLGENGHTVFVSSHLLHEVEQICTRVAIINKGRLLIESSVQALVAEQGRMVLEVSEAHRAAQLLKSHLSVAVIEESGEGRITTNLRREQVPEAVRLLVKEGIDVYGVATHKASLEDYFLSITAGSDEEESAEESLSLI